MKSIIRELHRGLTAERAKERFLREVGSVSSVEIAEIEQALIDEGLPAEEIRKFCNVHALLFESALQEAGKGEESPAHPLHLFKLENREIEKILGEARGLDAGAADFREQAAAILRRLGGLDTHYTRKEQVLFPYLERHEFFGPSKVMWGKDDEIRELLRRAAAMLAEVQDQPGAERFLESSLRPLIEEAQGMIFKEESILFPTALEKLSAQEWAEALRAGAEVGYAYIRPPAETAALADAMLRAVVDQPSVSGPEKVLLPSGELELKQLLGLLNALPVDLTFVDHEDRVRYFSEGKERVFLRPRSIIGRKVQNCHPPQSVAVVEGILESFRSGRRDQADFWIRTQGKLILIRYFAVRNAEGGYLGTLEVSQDITAIQKLEGERRLLDEAD